MADLIDAVEAESGAVGPLDLLVDAVGLADAMHAGADELVDHFVQTARANGHSWSEIGSTLGVTKQAAQQRFVGVSTPSARRGPPGLDDGASSVFAAAAGEARELGHQFVAPDHLVLGMFAQGDELAARTLIALGVSREQVCERVIEHLGRAPARAAGALGVAPETKRLLELAQTLAKRLGHRCARTEHLLLAVVSPPPSTSAGRFLADLGADDDRVRERLAAVLGKEAPELAARLRRRHRQIGVRRRVKT